MEVAGGRYGSASAGGVIGRKVVHNEAEPVVADRPGRRLGGEPFVSHSGPDAWHEISQNPRQRRWGGAGCAWDRAEEDPVPEQRCEHELYRCTVEMVTCQIEEVEVR